MQAIILANGDDHRFAAKTGAQIMPMIPFINQPLVSFGIEKLVRHGFREIAIATYEQTARLQAYCGQGQRWGVRLRYLPQIQPWGTAGVLPHMETGEQPFVLYPGDAIVDLDLSEAVSFHQSHGGVATAVLSPSQDAERPAAYTGVFIFNSHILKYIPDQKRWDIVQDLLPRIRRDGHHLRRYVMQGYWNPLQTPADYRQAQQVYLHSAADRSQNGGNSVRNPFVAGAEIGTGVWVGRNHAIHPAVKIIPPVSIGDNCQIANDVELGPNVVIGDNVIIDEGATIVNGTVLPETYVGQLVNIAEKIVDQNVIIDMRTGDSSTVVDRFLLTETSPPLVWGQGVRRLFDLVWSLLLLILTAPAALLISIIIFFGNKRNIVERREVLGSRPQQGMTARSAAPERINVLQFVTRGGDGRLTPTGAWLERWQLHRLPQLWAVLRGDMTMVGVKPVSSEVGQRLQEPWQRKRFDYPPGFTGLWFVQRGMSFEDEWVINDAYYVATRSHREDWRLLWQTVPAWWQHARRFSPEKLHTEPQIVKQDG